MEQVESEVSEPKTFDRLKYQREWNRSHYDENARQKKREYYVKKKLPKYGEFVELYGIEYAAKLAKIFKQLDDDNDLREMLKAELLK